MKGQSINIIKKSCKNYANSNYNNKNIINSYYNYKAFKNNYYNPPYHHQFSNDYDNESNQAFVSYRNNFQNIYNKTLFSPISSCIYYPKNYYNRNMPFLLQQKTLKIQKYIWMICVLTVKIFLSYWKIQI